jgi:serine/threonine protein kinase
VAFCGISREIKTHSKATGVVGTWKYMPPEAFKNPPSIMSQTDIWAVGVILQRLLTGNLPYPQDDDPSLITAILHDKPDDMPKSVSESLREIVKKSLQKNRADRFQTATEMYDALKNPQKFLESRTSLQARAIDVEDFDNPAQSEIEPIKDWLDPKKSRSHKAKKIWYGVIGAIILMLIMAGIIATYWKTNKTEQIANTSTNESQNNLANSANSNSPLSQELETPPIARKVQPPPNWMYFENSKQNLQGEMAKNFLGFSIYYPKGWVKMPGESSFLDVSKNSPTGITIKKVLITRYNSKGTFSADRALFPALKQKSDKDLSVGLEIYQFISEGETEIQNGRWKAFEVKFQGGNKMIKTGEKLLIWGRRLWIPVQRSGMKSGFLVTLVATSFAPNIKSVEDLMTDEELTQILETFEPSQIY